MDLEPRLLRYFLAVAQELHFGRAAARLYISQPSLSNQIHHLERTLGADLFVRTSRHVELTPAGRALLEQAPVALAALERAAEATRLAADGVMGTVRLGYAPMAGFDTLGVLLAAVAATCPTVTVVASEHFSSEIPGLVLSGDLDVGIALFPEPMRGVRSSVLRREPLAVLVGKDHRLAASETVTVADLQGETLLMFPRRLAPGYYDRVVAACERAGFDARIQSFADPPPRAMVSRLTVTGEVGLPPTAFAQYSASAEPELATRRLVDPEVPVDWSLVWPGKAPPAATAQFLAGARRCSEDNGWLLTYDDAAADAADAADEVTRDPRPTTNR